MSKESISEQEEYIPQQSNDKIQLNYNNPYQIDNPTIKGIPRMYDLRSSIPINQTLNFHNQNYAPQNTIQSQFSNKNNVQNNLVNQEQGQQLHAFYDQYYEPYHQYRRNYPCTQKYGFVNPDPMDGIMQQPNQNSQNNYQQSQQLQYQSLCTKCGDNVVQNCSNSNTMEQFYNKNDKYNNEITQQTGQSFYNPNQNNQQNQNYNQNQHQKRGNFADPYFGQLKQNQVKQLEKQERNYSEIETLHITLDHPDNPYLKDGKIVPQEKKTVVVKEYYPLKEWDQSQQNNQHTLEKYSQSSYRPQPVSVKERVIHNEISEEEKQKIIEETQKKAPYQNHRRIISPKSQASLVTTKRNNFN